jgi:hypothetical protein
MWMVGAVAHLNGIMIPRSALGRCVETALSQRPDIEDQVVDLASGGMGAGLSICRAIVEGAWRHVAGRGQSRRWHNLPLLSPAGAVIARCPSPAAGASATQQHRAPATTADDLRQCQRLVASGCLHLVGCRAHNGFGDSKSADFVGLLCGQDFACPSHSSTRRAFESGADLIVSRRPGESFEHLG